MDQTRLDQLKTYVKQSRDAGLTFDQVRAAMLSGGWTEDEVNEYLPAAWAETEPAAAPVAPVASAVVVPPTVAAPAMPVVAPTYAAPSAAPSYAASPAPAGSGLGAWITAGWELYKGDIGTILLGVLVAGLVGVVTVGVCLPPLAVGVFRMILKKHDGQQIAVGDVFEGFKFFGAAWGVFALVMLASFILAIPMGIIVAVAAKGGGDAAQGLSLVSNGVQTIIGWVIATVTLFAFPYIADERGGAIEALTVSWNTVKADFFNLLLAVIVTQIIGAAGVIACGIGVLFTAPLMQCIFVVIYRSRFPARAKA